MPRAPERGAGALALVPGLAQHPHEGSAPAPMGQGVRRQQSEHPGRRGAGAVVVAAAGSTTVSGDVGVVVVVVVVRSIVDSTVPSGIVAILPVAGSSSGDGGIVIVGGRSERAHDRHECQKPCSGGDRHADTGSAGRVRPATPEAMAPRQDAPDRPPCRVRRDQRSRKLDGRPRRREQIGGGRSDRRFRTPGPQRREPRPRCSGRSPPLHSSRAPDCSRPLHDPASRSGWVDDQLLTPSATVRGGRRINHHAQWSTQTPGVVYREPVEGRNRGSTLANQTLSSSAHPTCERHGDVFMTWWLPCTSPGGPTRRFGGWSKST